MNYQSLIVSILTICSPLLVNGQTSVKDQIRSTVADMYPGYTVDEIEKESWCNGETLLEVEIEKGEEENEQEMTLLFSTTGNIRYREDGIKPADLPKVVVDAFRSACPDCGDSREVDMLTALDGGENVYEVEGRKGLRKYCIIIRESGQLLCRL
ncbi:MAG: hypothetical protein K9I85_13870 [Saprospiraceae bacterium]|nr:hypothetical protein [Saprospiraceae bacterium]